MTDLKKVIIVDDEHNIRFLIKTALEDLPLEIFSAEDGEKALVTYNENGADLVITDIIMPNKEGAQLISELKNKDPELKIIAISGGGLIGPTTYLELAHQLGADHVLPKPFRVNELKDLVKATLELV